MLEMPARCSRCDSISPAGPAPTMPTWVRMVPPPSDATIAGYGNLSKGRKPESLVNLAAARRLSAGSGKPILGANHNNKTLHPGEIRNAPHSVARGPEPLCLHGLADRRRLGAKRGPERTSHLRRRGRHGGR